MIIKKLWERISIMEKRLEKKVKIHRLFTVLWLIFSLFTAEIPVLAEENTNSVQNTGDYVFRFDGGTMGHVMITCDKVEIVEGQVYATITFTRKSHGSGKAQFSQVSSLGETVIGDNTFTIPVNYNENTEIEAYSTAMSQGHWIKYTIYIGEAEENQDTLIPESSDEKDADETGNDQMEYLNMSPEIEKIEPPVIEGLTFEKEMELDYARGFQVFYYSDGYKDIYIPGSGNYLLIPEDGEEPDDLPMEDTTVITLNPCSIYLAAPSVMSFFDALERMDALSMSATDKSGWYIEAPQKAMEEGTLLFAGKYSEPDYEMLVMNDCDLVIESTMIFHAPEVQEMLEDLDFPVLIDRSSYETTAFGRIEWIKLYGALLNEEEKAMAFYQEEEKILAEMETYQPTGKTAAFFSVNANGSVVVRKSDDFIPNMIELAGGSYIFQDLANPGSNSPSVNINMEEFYHVAMDADYLIYNATIENALTNLEDLLDLDPLFEEFLAVQEDHVWQVDRTWYQSTAKVGHLITDFHIMFSDGDQNNLMFLSKVGK